MPDFVGASEVDDREIGPRPVVEVARDALRDARRAENAPEPDDGILHPGSARKRRGDLRLGKPEVGREVRGGNASVPRGDLRNAGLEAFGKGRARARKVRKEDGARAVGDEVAVDLFGRMRRPPADDADFSTRRRGQVPGRGRPPRATRDRDLAARLRVDLLEVEDAMHVGRDARRRRRPEHRRNQRVIAREPRRVALLRQPLPVRHRALGGEPIEQLEVEPVETEPDDGGLRSGSALFARGDVGGFDGPGRRERASRRVSRSPAAVATAGVSRRQAANPAKKAGTSATAREIRIRGTIAKGWPPPSPTC